MKAKRVMKIQADMKAMKAMKVMKKKAAMKAMKAMKKKAGSKAAKDEMVWDCARCLANIPPGWKNKACIICGDTSHCKKGANRVIPGNVGGIIKVKKASMKVMKKKAGMKAMKVIKAMKKKKNKAAIMKKSTKLINKLQDQLKICIKVAMKYHEVSKDAGFLDGDLCEYHLNLVKIRNAH